MATILGTLGVILEANSAGLQKGLAAANKSLDDFGKNAAKVAAIATAATAAIAGGIALAVKAADEQRKAEIRLAAAVRGTSEAIDPQALMDQASALQDVTAFGDEATLGLQAFLVGLRLNQDAITGLTPLVQDLAAATGKNLNRVVKAVASSLEGSASSLATMGVALTDAEKAAFKFANTNERAAIVTGALQRSVGGVAQAAGKTGVAAFERFTNRIGDLLEQIGFLFDQPVAGFFLKMEGAVKSVTGTIENMSPETKQLTVAITAMAGAVTSLVAAWAGLKVILPVVRSLTLAVLGPFLVVGGIILGLVLIIGAMRLAWEADLGGIRTAVQDFTKNVIFEFNELKRDLAQIIDDLGETFVTFLAFISGEDPEKAFQSIRKLRFAGGVSGLAGETGADIGETVVSGTKAAFDGLKKSFIAGAKTVLQPFGVSLQDVGKVLDFFGESTEDAAGLSAEALDELAAKGDKAGKALEDVEPKVRTLGDAIRESISKGLANLFEGLKPIIGTSAAKGLTQGLQIAFDIIAPVVARAGENVSAAIEGAAKGFEVGGPIGALIGAIVALLTQTEGFRQILDMLNSLLGSVVKQLGKFIGALIPSIEAVSESAELMFLMMNEINLFGVVVAALGKVSEGVAFVIRKVTDAFRAAFNFVIDLIADLVKKLGFKGLAKSIRKARIESDELTDFLAKDSMAMPEMPGAEDLPGILDDVGDSMQKFGEATQKVTEALTNVPAGFRVALRRFEATVPGVGGGPGDFGGGEAMAGGGNIMIDNFFVDTTDVPAFLALMQNEEDFRNFLQDGTSVRIGGDFGVDRKGA